MGCLKVNINPVPGFDNVSVVGRNDLTFMFSVVKKNFGRCARAVFACLNDIIVSVSAANDYFSVSTDYACSKPTIDIGIICKTDLDTEYYLQVLDGFVITLDGCFVKVNKG